MHLCFLNWILVASAWIPCQVQELRKKAEARGGVSVGAWDEITGIGKLYARFLGE